MLQNPTVLVLGAGASKTVGYPVGLTLRAWLITIKDRSVFDSSGLIAHKSDLDRFVTEFERSQLYSIDSFLARRPDFGEIGKLAIAATLIGCEDERVLINPIEEDRWYQYLLNTIVAGTWEELDFSNLTVITFNYDRSLEHFLLISLKAAFGRSEEAVLEKIATLRVIHCYGTLGPTLPGAGGYWPYGAPVTEERVRQAAKCIQVLPEGREDSPAFDAARSALSVAHTIVFLGFGFDKMNLERLHSQKTCAAVFKSSTEVKRRRIAATCFKLTDAEISAARNATAGTSGGAIELPDSSLGIVRRSTFMNVDCISLLRSTGFLNS